VLSGALRTCLAAVIGDLAVEPADVGPVPLDAVPLRCGTHGRKPTTLRSATKGNLDADDQ